MSVEKFKTDYKFQLDKGCYDQLIDYVDINWDEMLESPNKTVDENWEDFKSILLKGMNMFIPKVKKSPIKWRKKVPSFQQRAPAADPYKASTLESLDLVQTQTGM